MAQNFVHKCSGTKLKNAPRPGLFWYLLRLIRKTWGSTPAGNSKSSFNFSSLYLEGQSLTEYARGNVPACGKMVSQVYTALVPPFCSPPGEVLGHTVMQFSPPAIPCNPFWMLKNKKTYSPDFQPCLLSSTFLGTNTSNLVLNVGVDKTANICPWFMLGTTLFL